MRFRALVRALIPVFSCSMHPSSERALWLARSVLPHEPALRAWLRHKNAPGIEIDDVVQETYARLSTIAEVEKIRDPKTYMFQVAHSIVVSAIRRSRIVPIMAVAHLEALETPAEAPDPETQINDHQELHKLAEAIGRLPGKIRDVFILRRVHDLPQREVARRLGLSENTVEKHMSKGFALMADLFSRGGSASRQTSIHAPQGSQHAHDHDDGKGH